MTTNNINRVLKTKEIVGDFDTIPKMERKLLAIIADSKIVEFDGKLTFYNKRDLVSMIHYNYGTNFIWCSYDYIWSIFEREYGLKYMDTLIIIQNVFKTQIIFKDLTPIGYISK